MLELESARDFGVNSVNAILAKRPYIAEKGSRYAGQPVICQVKGAGKNAEYYERPVNNATLRKDEWQELDTVIVEAARERLVGVDDLISRGLTHSLGGVGVLTAQWEAGSEMTDANITMDGETVDDQDRQEFALRGVPVPVVHKDFKLSLRVLEASRTIGAALDVTTGAEAGQSVARSSEKILFNGASIKSDGYTIHGYTTHPNRNIASISDWSTASGATILSETTTLIQTLRQDRHYGPVIMYIPAEYEAAFEDDLKAETGISVRERLLRINGLEDIKVADVLGTGEVVLAEMSRTNVDMAIAQDVSTMEWQPGSQWTTHYQAAAVWVPRFKDDFDGRLGVVHATATSS